MKLSEYVQRVMREKGLSLQAVEKNSHKQISFGYVNDIIQEKTKNPSVDKLKALALGLRVDEDEIFRIARGLAIDPQAEDNIRKSSLNQLFDQLPEIAQSELLGIAEVLMAVHQAYEEKKGSEQMIAKKEEPNTLDTQSEESESIPWSAEDRALAAANKSNTVDAADLAKEDFIEARLIGEGQALDDDVTQARERKAAEQAKKPAKK